jgi:hypothetical protein
MTKAGSSFRLSLLLTLVWPKGTAFVYRAEIKRGSIAGLPPAVGASGRYAHWVPSLADMNGLQALIQYAKLLLGIDGLGVLVRVVAKCDFLIDKNGKCIDGNHLRGSVRSGPVTGDESGDGVSGGEFESWFQLVDDPRNPDVSPAGLSARLLSGRPTKREKDALEKLFPGIEGLASFFNKGD